MHQCARATPFFKEFLRHKSVLFVLFRIWDAWPAKYFCFLRIAAAPFRNFWSVQRFDQTANYLVSTRPKRYSLQRRRFNEMRTKSFFSIGKTAKMPSKSEFFQEPTNRAETRAFSRQFLIKFHTATCSRKLLPATAKRNLCAFCGFSLNFLICFCDFDLDSSWWGD